MENTLPEWLKESMKEADDKAALAFQKWMAKGGVLKGQGKSKLILCPIPVSEQTYWTVCEEKGKRVRL